MAANTHTPPHDGVDVVSVITHLVEEMYDHLDTLNGDIDRLTVQRDRMKAAILALVPPDDTLPTESARPGVTTAAPASVEQAPRRQRATSTGTTTKHDLAAVAEVARSAFVDGRPMATAVATILDVNAKAASNLIFRARKAGFDVPTPRSATTVAPTPAAAAPAGPWTPDRARDALEGAA